MNSSEQQIQQAKVESDRPVHGGRRRRQKGFRGVAPKPAHCDVVDNIQAAYRNSEHILQLIVASGVQPMHLLEAAEHRGHKAIARVCRLVVRHAVRQLLMQKFEEQQKAQAEKAAPAAEVTP